MGGLEPIVELVRQLQNLLIQQISNLSARRIRIHHEVISKELDLEALDVFFVHHGFARDSLWTIASYAPDVLILQQFFPYLNWIDPNLERTLQKVESDIQALFKAVRAFESHVNSVPLVET